MSTSTPSLPAATSSSPLPALHITFLDGIRGLAALYVVLFHFLAMNAGGLTHGQSRLAKLAQGGHSAVTVFIVLSGFSLMLPVARAADGRLQGGTAGFLKRRARRILPPYYAALLLSLLGLVFTPNGLDFLQGRVDPHWVMDFTAPMLLSHFFLLHNMTSEWGHGINQALWSVATEWQIYFALPLLLLPAWRRGGVWALLAAGLALGIAPVLLLLLGSPFIPQAAWYAGVFGIGAAGAVWSWHGLSNEENRPAMRRKALVALVVLAAAYVLASKYVAPTHTLTDNAGRNYLNGALKDYLLGGLFVCLLIYGTLARDLRRPLGFAPFRLLETPAARTLGAFSYSLYLTHCIILTQAESWFAQYQFTPVSAFTFKALFGVPIAVAFAYLFHLVFEKPFMVRSRSRNLQLLAEAPPTP